MTLPSTAPTSFAIVVGIALSAVCLPRLQAGPTTENAQSRDVDAGVSEGSKIAGDASPADSLDAGIDTDAHPTHSDATDGSQAEAASDVVARIAPTPAAVPVAAPTPESLPAPKDPSAPVAILTRKAHAALPVDTRPRRLPILGLGGDVGLPDGANASLVVRPRSWARLHAALGTNGISRGYRVGTTIVPLGDGPSLMAEVGHYDNGNANRAASKLLGSGYRPSPLLESVGYDYLNLHLGLNFGYRYAAFFVQGGLSMVRGRFHNVTLAQTETSTFPGKTTIGVREDPVFKATGIAGKLGLIFYVW